jgi:uncharacterized protein
MAEPGPAQKQSWRHLLFLHWEVSASALKALLPPGLELDTFQGRAFVGLVPFTMTGVRPVWAPVMPWLSHFHETNVRTYVRRGDEAGVWFFSLDAANPLAVAGARALFSLPYFYASMRMDVEAKSGEEPIITYASRRRPPGPRPATLSLRYQPTGAPAPARPGTLEHFLAERYSLFSLRGGKLRLGRVRHAPYPLQGARVDSWDESLLRAAGIQRPNVMPLAHYAHGVDVDVFALENPIG